MHCVHVGGQVDGGFQYIFERANGFSNQQLPTELYNDIVKPFVVGLL